MKQFFKNIECTKEVILYTTILSNNASKEWEEDSKKLIDFICEAYSNKLQDDYLKLIAYEISNLSTINEYKLLFNKASFSDEFDETSVLYDIKGRAMMTINQLFRRIENVNMGMFSYFDYNSINPYNNIERSASLLQASRYGDVELSVMAGLLYATGIGGKQNYRLAKLRFLQAAYWGCFSAFKYAALISKKLGENSESKFYSEMYSACSGFLSEGVTIIPLEYQTKYTKKTQDYFSLVASIYFDVVLLYKIYTINFSFVEVMMLDDLSLADKMKYVNNYNEYKWKEETGIVESKTLSKIGFNI